MVNLLLGEAALGKHEGLFPGRMGGWPEQVLLRKAGGIYLRNVHQHLAKPVVSPTSQVSVLSFKAEHPREGIAPNTDQRPT